MLKNNKNPGLYIKNKDIKAYFNLWNRKFIIHINSILFGLWKWWKIHLCRSFVLYL